MNGKSSVTLIFTILILKFNNQVKQLLTHVGTNSGPNVTSLLWVTFTLSAIFLNIYNKIHEHVAHVSNRAGIGSNLRMFTAKFDNFSCVYSKFDIV